MKRRRTQKKTAVDSRPHIPSEVVFEILLRATLETLGSCKSVSKEWRDLICDPRFVALYRERNNTFAGCGYFIQDARLRGSLPIFVSLDEQKVSVCDLGIPEGMEILASCKQGIVLCKNWEQDEHDYFVGKPAAEKWAPLPNPNLRNEDVVVGIVVLGSNPVWFKVVRLVCIWGGTTISYEIFDTKVGRWGRVGVAAFPDSLCIEESPSVSASGSIYWHTVDNYVLAFNGLDDSFDMFHLPNSISPCLQQLHELSGSLVFVCSKRSGELELWEMKDSSSPCWRKKRKFHGKVCRERYRPCGNHEIIYSKVFDEILFHCLMCWGCNYVKNHRHPHLAGDDYRIFPFKHELGLC